MAAALPADVTIWPWSTYSVSGSNVTSGNIDSKRRRCRQCVTAEDPSRRPVAATAKAPRHNPTSVVPFWCASRIAETKVAGTSVVSIGQVGMTRTSARSSQSSRRSSPAIVSPPSSSTTVSSVEHEMNSMFSPAGVVRPEAQTPAGVEASNSEAPGGTTLTTVCRIMSDNSRFRLWWREHPSLTMDL